MKYKIGKETFYSKESRNEYAFNNKDSLEAGYDFDKWIYFLFLGILVATLIGLPLAYSIKWYLFFVPFPIVWFIISVIMDSKKQSIEEYAEAHRQYEIKQKERLRRIEKKKHDHLCKREEQLRDVLENYHDRYSTWEEKDKHNLELIEYIRYKKDMIVERSDLEKILRIFIKERNIRSFDSDIDSLEKITLVSLARLYISETYERDIENEIDSSSLFETFCEFLDRKGINYGAWEIKYAIKKQCRLDRVKQFEDKLSRNQVERVTTDNIYHLNGFEFEELIGKLYRKQGYSVTVTQKSGDQGADIIVEKNGVRTAVQTKKSSGRVGNKAVQEVVAAKKYYDCDNAVVIITGHFTKGAIELAEINKVEIIDKEDLDVLFDDFF
jgi:hypothetical protein